MSYSVEELLNFLKLDEYLPNFKNNNITNLHIINELLLINIGIDKVGHRKRILHELGNLLGTGNYSLPGEHKNDNFNGMLNVNKDNEDEIAPPLPPKSKTQHNSKETTISSKNVDTSSEPVSPNKQRPVKPPRRTIPGGLQKPPIVQVQTQIPPDEEPSIKTLHEPIEPASPMCIQSSQATVPTPNSPILPAKSTSPQSSSESTIPSLPVQSSEPTATTSFPSLTFPPPPTSPPPPTPKFQIPPRPTQTRPVMRTFSQKRAAPATQPSIPVPFVPEPVIQPQTQASELPQKPVIPPRDYPDDRSVHEPSISKAARSSRAKSVDLMSFNDIALEPEENTSDISDKHRPRSTNLKKSYTIGSADKGLEAALRRVQLNKFNSAKKASTISFNQQGSLALHDETCAVTCSSCDSKESSCNVPAKEVAEYEEMLKELKMFSYSDDELSEDEEYFKDAEELEGTPISMRRDKDELISIVGNRDSTAAKPASLHRKSRFFQPKSGFLYMRCGKRSIKRWVEFTGSEIKCYKERNGILKLTIPVMKMTDVIWEKDAKKPTFHILTKTNKYTFIESIGDHDGLTIWANVILEGVMAKGDEVDDDYTSGGIMANPDMEGYLLKEGHNIIHDMQKRYVVIKENKLCYYNNKEEFEKDMDFISCLEMALISLKCDYDKHRLVLNTHMNKSYVFQAEDAASFNSWKEAIETAIQYSHGDDTVRNQIQENKSNMKCADCGENNPIYASINLLVVACPKCIGVHRDMGVHISKTRSLLMDDRVWTPSSIKLLQVVGNEKANSLWAYKLPADDMIYPYSTKEERELFIKNKYKDKKYFDWPSSFGAPEELGDKIREVVVTDNVLETLKLLISGADIYYVPEGSADQRTPYQLAKDAGMELQVELLYQFNGHLTKEERTEKEQQKSAMQQIKTGLLQIKTTRNDTLKERQCTLLDKRIEVKKVDKIDECEIIDLTKLEELEIDKEDQVTLMLKLPDRTYFLKSCLAEEALSWYHAIRNKQVFGVPIEVQACNKKKIPHLIAECISFMEQHALTTQGIYRLNGSQIIIKRLLLLFNQDAANLRLQIDDFPDIHAVAGLIKLYLRQLPDPLFTKKLYEEWIRNAEDTSNEDERIQKLYRYKSLLEELPLSNYKTLRFLILHLNQVINLSEVNKMALNNIIVIFGPIMLSCGNTVDQAWLKREYSVLSDLLTYYQWLFDVTEVEVKVLTGMIDFLRSTQQPQQQQPTVADFTMVTIFVGGDEDQMKMTATTKPSEVCLFCIKKHKLSVNTNWGLFEMTMGEDLERLVHASECVLKLAENMGVKRKLVVKCNYVTDLISAHLSKNLCVTGTLHYNKGDKWKKGCYVEVKTGNIRVYRAKGNKEEENLAIHEIQLFIGNEQKKKPQTRYGFALYKAKEDEFRSFGSDDEIEVNKFIANILQIKYPSGVWTPISDSTDEPVLSGISEDSSYWGRQSTITRPRGTANRLVMQLERRRTTLKNIFTK